MISDAILTGRHDVQADASHVTEPTSGRPMSWTSDPPFIPGMLASTAPDQRSSNVLSFIDNLLGNAKLSADLKRTNHAYQTCPTVFPQMLSSQPKNCPSLDSISL